jgi:uncharacterized membrane protein
MKMLEFCCALIAIIALAVGGWYLAKKINYSLGYDAMVRETVCDMVKQEYLKQDCAI